MNAQATQPQLIEEIFTHYQLAGTQTDQLAGFLCVCAAQHLAVELSEVYAGISHNASLARSICSHILHREEGMSPTRIVKVLKSTKTSWAIRKGIRRITEALQNPKFNQAICEQHSAILTRYKDFKNLLNHA